MCSTQLHGNLGIFCYFVHCTHSLSWQLVKQAYTEVNNPVNVAGCGMCAVPVDGLHKDDVTHEQLVKIQGLLKRRIPTGRFFRSHTTFHMDTCLRAQLPACIVAYIRSCTISCPHVNG